MTTIIVIIVGVLIILGLVYKLGENAHVIEELKNRNERNGKQNGKQTKIYSTPYVPDPFNRLRRKE